MSGAADRGAVPGRPMRVLILVRSQSGVPGGAGVPGGQIGMIQIARALARRGTAVELFVGGDRMAYLSGLSDVDTTCFRWPHWRDRLAAASPGPVRELNTRLRRRRWLDAVTSLPATASADVIHVQGLRDAEPLLGRLGGPLVVTHWGRVGRWRCTGRSRHDGALRNRVRRIADDVELVAIGEAQRDELAQVGLPPSEVIPPGIDLDHFTPADRGEARRRLDLPPGEGVVLYVGRLSGDKNVETLLRAFALPSVHARRVRLLIVGDGPLRERLERLSVELGIAAVTTFRPFVPHAELAEYYRSCDVTVVPSDRLETFCMVALEAIASGSPVIVTGQVPEIVRRFPSVPSVDPFDVEGFRRHIDEALDGRVAPADRSRIADYGWNGVAQRYEAVYRSAVRWTAREGRG